MKKLEKLAYRILVVLYDFLNLLSGQIKVLGLKRTKKNMK
jgi:hypothetical protein